jgi:hypothetical protein
MKPSNVLVGQHVCGLSPKPQPETLAGNLAEEACEGTPGAEPRVEG